MVYHLPSFRQELFKLFFPTASQGLNPQLTIHSSRGLPNQHSGVQTKLHICFY